MDYRQESTNSVNFEDDILKDHFSPAGRNRGSQVSLSNSEASLRRSHSIESMNQHKDLVEFIAEEKNLNKQEIRRRKQLWQTCIFLMAFFITFLISFRDSFVYNIMGPVPDSSENYSINICRGVGFLMIGNFYDNVQMPKHLTFLLLCSLAFLNGLVSKNTNSLILMYSKALWG